MKTRGNIYGNEAIGLLRDITMYKALAEEQIYRLYPGKETIMRNLLTHLNKQKRIYRNPNDKRFFVSAECDEKKDAGMIAAVWVLVDFIDRVEYHYAGDFPVKIVFFADGELYEIVYVPYEQEILMSHALAAEKEPDARRIVIVDSPGQLDAIDIPNAAGYCSVDFDGSVHYYKLE